MAADHSDDEQARRPSQPAHADVQQDASSHSNCDSRRWSASPANEKEAASGATKITISTSDRSEGEEEEAPPLPDEAPPEDDGWEAKTDLSSGSWYFYNRFTGVSQWENPRVPEATAAGQGSYDRYPQTAAADATTSSGAPGTSSPPRRKYGGYNPAIHGDYDPNADYALEAQRQEEAEEAAAASAAAVAAGLPDPNRDYTTTAHFNRFTGRFQHASVNPELHNDENKSKRQMSAFFDVDAAANSHDGRSLKAERRNKSLTKKELKAFKDKRREKKEEKRRAWLRD